MLNEEELELALTTYLEDNITTSFTRQRWAHAPGRERATRLMIRARYDTDFEALVPHILAFPQPQITVAIGIIQFIVQTTHTLYKHCLGYDVVLHHAEHATFSIFR